MIILSNQYDSISIIQEEKEQWICAVLLELGMKKEELEKDSFSSREIMHNYGIELMTHVNGTVEISKDRKIVGKWEEPILTLKLDKDNKIYYEIELVYESLLDNVFSFSKD